VTFSEPFSPGSNMVGDAVTVVHPHSPHAWLIVMVCELPFRKGIAACNALP
jgi:hypothetical protein